jgi:uncharacterized protein with NAD-binding domain and iron-sulfur cluster
VRDGYSSINGTRGGEAGQHGFWDNYINMFALLDDLPNIDSIDDVLTGYAEQGQYSPRGLEAVWPVFGRPPRLPTGLRSNFRIAPRVGLPRLRRFNRLLEEVRFDAIPRPVRTIRRVETMLRRDTRHSSR